MIDIFYFAMVTRVASGCQEMQNVPILCSYTKLHSAGCPHNVAQLIAGHAAQGVHDQVYVHREQLPLKLLTEGLEKRYLLAPSRLGLTEYLLVENLKYGYR